jgi:hypothetical protein
MNATKTPDDLEAVRSIAETLALFKEQERERILRWVRERLGMVTSAPTDLPGTPRVPSGPLPSALNAPDPSRLGLGQDIKSFIDGRTPRNDVQLAATVAYYYRFVAPERDRKDAITADELIDACRLAQRRRPARARQTMFNALRGGVFDKVGRGAFRLNSVGENLVAMVLPGAGDTPSQARSPRKRVSSRTRSKKVRARAAK